MNCPKLDVRQDASAIERLERVKHGTRLLHAGIEPLWEELNEPDGLRALAVRGFANIVRQHAIAQWVLVQHELDISATALVRPTYEALLRTIWALRGADDAWISGFFSPQPEAIQSDAETRKGPDVQAMLDVIARHHPADIHQPLVALKEATWRLMHSYVHGGDRKSTRLNQSLMRISYAVFCLKKKNTTEPQKP